MIDDICAGLYDITNENYRITGEELPFLKLSLINALRQQDNAADISALEKLEGMEFAESVYANCLYRPMDDDSIKQVRERMEVLPPDKFKEFLVRSVVSSREFVTRNMKLTGSSQVILPTRDSLPKRAFRAFYFRYLRLSRHIPWLKTFGSRVSHAIRKKTMFR